MKRMFLLFVTVITLISLIIGCSGEANKPNNTENAKEEKSGENSNLSNGPSEGGIITVGTSSEPDSLDPHSTGQAAANVIMGNIGASLVFQNPETKEFEPYLAESWETSNDGKTWTFKLREDVKFHDGTPLTAEDFVKTYDRARDTNFVASGNLKELDSAEALDDYTLVLNLKSAFAPLLQYLSDPGWLQPLPKELIAEGKEFNREPIGVGPWKFDDWKNGEAIILARNGDFLAGPQYFKNTNAVYPEKLEYKFISEVQTLLAALESGSVDIATGVPANQIEKYLDNADYYVLEKLRNGLGLFIVFNLDHVNFKELEVRQAINYAIDKDAIVKAVLNGHGEVAYGPLPSSFFGFDENSKDYGYQNDTEKAIELIESVGYTKGGDGIYEKNGEKLEFSLMTQTNGESWEQTATLVQAMLKEVGMKVNVESREWGSLLDAATKHQFDMTLMGYTYNDPDVLTLFLNSSESNGGLNLGSVNDSKLDNLLYQGRTTVDLDKRKEIYVEAQKHIVENAYWAPLWTEEQFTVISKNIQGITMHPLYSMLYQDGWVEK